MVDLSGCDTIRYEHSSGDHSGTESCVCLQFLGWVDCGNKLTCADASRAYGE